MNARTMKTLLSLACAALVLAMPMRVHAQGAIGTVVTLTGYFVNASSLTPVEANYAVYDSQGKKVGQSFRSSATDGYLQTGLKAGQTYTIRVEDPRYFRQEFAIDIPATSKYLELSKDFVVRPMEAGRKIKVTPVPFDVKKSTLKAGAEDDLARTRSDDEPRCEHRDRVLPRHRGCRRCSAEDQPSSCRSAQGALCIEGCLCCSY